MEDYSFRTGVMFNTSHISRSEQANKIEERHMGWRGEEGHFGFWKPLLLLYGSGCHKVDTITMVPYGSLDTSEGQQTFFITIWPLAREKCQHMGKGMKTRRTPPPLFVIIQSCLIVFALVCGLGERETISPHFFVKANCLFFFGKQSYRDRRRPLGGHRKTTMSN